MTYKQLLDKLAQLEQRILVLEQEVLQAKRNKPIVAQEKIT